MFICFLNYLMLWNTQWVAATAAAAEAKAVALMTLLSHFLEKKLPTLYMDEYFSWLNESESMKIIGRLEKIEEEMRESSRGGKAVVEEEEERN